MRHSIAIKFPVEINEDGMSYIVDSRIRGTAYGKKATVVRKLRPVIEAAVDEALEARENADTVGVVSCADGHVLVVRFRHGGWGYDMFGPERRACSCHSSKSFEETFQDALDHADQGFGGVVFAARGYQESFTP